MIKEIEQILCIKLGISPVDFALFKASFYEVKGTGLIMVSILGENYLAVCGEGFCFEDFNGDLLLEGLKLCPLTHANRLALNKHVPYTVPRAFGSRIPTFGAGDRLGLAADGLLQIITRSRAKPVLAQQSKRELELTGRTFHDVLDCASYSVFLQGYQGGFGADGDHLKQKADILEALECGYSMITLDCSEKIGRGIEQLTDFEAEKKYHALPDKTRLALETKYLDQPHSINETDLIFSKQELIKNVLVYYEAIGFIIEIYENCLAKLDRDIDFEISIDETESTTSKYGHFFVASELFASGVKITSLAPRFIGEFQKGIDYIGDLAEFEKQLSIHSAIADFFGYKLSIHSGSDKFSVFPVISRYTAGRLHIKVSGTNWLEALATIAECSPNLYRAIHRCALKHFEEARKYYRVSADLSKISDLDSISDNNLLDYLKKNDSRQLLHITYGFILKDLQLRASIYEVLQNNSAVYTARLIDHIGRHLGLLGLL